MDSFTGCDKAANLQQFTLILRSGWVLHCFNWLHVLSVRQTSLPFPKELTEMSYKKHIQNFETWLKHEPLSKSLELSKKVKSFVSSTNPQRGSYKHNTIPSDKEHWNIPFGRLWRRKKKFTFKTLLSTIKTHLKQFQQTQCSCMLKRSKQLTPSL